MEQDNKKILVVDDTELNRELLCRRLLRRGYHVEEGVGGQDALSKTSSHDYDLILLDIMMPDLDGISVLKQLRQDTKHVDLPVIMISARAEKELIDKAMEAGANDYITKPIQFNDALEKIEQAIRN